MRNLSIAAILLAASTLPGASITLGPVSHPLTTTNWNTVLNLPQFDTLGGTRVLTGVQITLRGAATGDIQLESLDNAPSTISATLGAQITANLPFGSLSVQVNPATNQQFNAAAYDGNIDFGGTSGITFLGVSANDTDTLTLLAGDPNLGNFIGIGNIAIPVSAIGASTATGAGNLVTIFRTQGSAELEVTYTFDTVGVPEPSTWALAGAGLVLAGIRRRR